MLWEQNFYMLLVICLLIKMKICLRFWQVVILSSTFFFKFCFNCHNFFHLLMDLTQTWITQHLWPFLDDFDMTLTFLWLTDKWIPLHKQTKKMSDAIATQWLLLGISKWELKDGQRSENIEPGQAVWICRMAWLYTVGKGFQQEIRVK